MKHYLLSTAIAVAGVLFAAQPASAAVLTYLYELDVANPEGLAYDPDDGTIWVADGSEVIRNINADGSVNTVFEIEDPFFDNFQQNNGISVYGENLFLSNSDGQAYVVTRTGDIVRSMFLSPSADADGLFFDASAGEIIVADDADEMIYFLRERDSGAGAPEVVVVDQFSTLDVDPEFFKPEGVVLDPTTGNLLVVDSGGAGTSSLYELTRSGALVSVTDLVALTTFTDPTGVTLGPDGTLFIAFADADRIVAFDFEGTVIPVPAALPLLATGLACLGLVSRRRRRVLKNMA